MSIPLSQPVADRLYRALVDGYDAAAAQSQGEVYLSRLTILLAAEVALPERVIELITLANHHLATPHIEREAA